MALVTATIRGDDKPRRLQETAAAKSSTTNGGKLLPCKCSTVRGQTAKRLCGSKEGLLLSTS